MRSLSPQHTHRRPARVCGKGEAWNGRCVFRLNGKCYDAAMNVVVIHSMLNYHAGNVERPLCKQRSDSTGGEYHRLVGDGYFHTMIAPLPEEE